MLYAKRDDSTIPAGCWGERSRIFDEGRLRVETKFEEGENENGKKREVAGACLHLRGGFLLRGKKGATFTARLKKGVCELQRRGIQEGRTLGGKTGRGPFNTGKT